MISVRNLFVGVLLGALWLAAPMASAQMRSPSDEVKAGVDEVLALLGNDSIDPGKRRGLLRDALVPHFDFVTMSRSVLAANWKKATPAEQERFVELFQELLGDVYITAMEEYSGQTVRIGKERLQGKLASVETFIVRASAGEIPVHYRLKVRNDRWLAYDVTVEGVSIVSNYRSSFNSIVRKKGVAGLIEDLDKKVNDAN